jgi:CO/xanthine dehydrogenase Mo-binding subunit
MSVIGANVRRVDGRSKVTGTAPYNVDIRIPGALHVRGVRSPYPHARVVSVDATSAAAIAGVIVLTREDLGSDPYFGPVFRDESIVAVEKVRYVGDLVAAVAAPTLRLAEEAAELVAVEYEPLPTVSDPLEALEPGAPILHERLQDDMAADSRAHSIQPGLETLESLAKGNLCGSYHFEAGDIERGFAEADRIFEDEFRVPPIQHAHLEPHTAVAYWEGSARLVLNCSTQDPWVVRSEMADLFGIEQHDVRVTCSYLGGGFGAKLYPRIEAVVAALARKASRPVTWTLTREEEFLTITRHAAVVQIRSGAKADGTIVARQVRIVYDGGAYAEISPRVAAQNGAVASGPYRIRNQSVDCLVAYTCKPPAGAFRGFGVPQLAFAYESQMDDIARELGMDAVELRRRNLLHEGERFVTGEELLGVGVGECLTKVADELGWNGAVRKDDGVPPRSGKARAMGIACSMKSTMTPSNSAASLRLDPDGSLTVLTSAVEVGQGTTTVLAQIVAETVGIPVGRVFVAKPDTDATPFDHGTKSSRVTFSVGRAAISAAREIRRQLIQLGAQALEVAEEDVDVVDGIVVVRGTDRTLEIPEVFSHAFGLPVGNLFGHGVFQTTGGLDPQTYQGKDSAFWMWAAVGAEVEVDLETGKVHVLRVASALDTGRTLNPIQCHLQNEGSVTMALGSALLEEMVFDEGQLLNGSFTSYPIPSMADFPMDFRSFLVEAPHPDGPFGAKGVGESPFPAVAPAIRNAVVRALGGVAIRSLPLRGDVILAAIDAER